MKTVVLDERLAQINANDIDKYNTTYIVGKKDKIWGFLIWDDDQYVLLRPDLDKHFGDDTEANQSLDYSDLVQAIEGFMEIGYKFYTCDNLKEVSQLVEAN
jgi:hypothetical protein